MMSLAKSNRKLDYKGLYHKGFIIFCNTMFEGRINSELTIQQLNYVIVEPGSSSLYTLLLPIG